MLILYRCAPHSADRHLALHRCSDFTKLSEGKNRSVEAITIKQVTNLVKLSQILALRLVDNGQNARDVLADDADL